MTREVRHALLVGAQGQRLAHDLIDVDHRARRLPLARERKEVPARFARRAPTRSRIVSSPAYGPSSRSAAMTAVRPS